MPKSVISSLKSTKWKHDFYVKFIRGQSTSGGFVTLTIGLFTLAMCGNPCLLCSPREKCLSPLIKTSICPQCEQVTPRGPNNLTFPQPPSTCPPPECLVLSVQIKKPKLMYFLVRCWLWNQTFVLGLTWGFMLLKHFLRFLTSHQKDCTCCVMRRSILSHYT